MILLIICWRWECVFERNEDGSLAYTREGAHSKPRICFHKDITGEEITTTLLSHVRRLENVTMMEYTTMTDIIEKDGVCVGMKARDQNGDDLYIYAPDTVMATGGIGGLYRHSTNFPLLTGDACRIAKEHGVQPVTLGRRILRTETAGMAVLSLIMYQLEDR